MPAATNDLGLTICSTRAEGGVTPLTGLWSRRFGQVHHVIPAQAGIQVLKSVKLAARNWIPAFAGMTACPWWARQRSNTG
jgi:hypothetical protein